MAVIPDRTEAASACDSPTLLTLAGSAGISNSWARTLRGTHVVPMVLGARRGLLRQRQGRPRVAADPRRIIVRPGGRITDKKSLVGILAQKRCEVPLVPRHAVDDGEAAFAGPCDGARGLKILLRILGSQDERRPALAGENAAHKERPGATERLKASSGLRWRQL